MIQGVVDRLANNSALVKNWTVAMLAALLLFSRVAAEGSDRAWVSVGMLALTLVFWVLDGYYLNQERLFRKLYDRVRMPDCEPVDYSMDTSEFRERGLAHYVSLVFGLLKSVSVGPFYGILSVLCIVHLLVS